MSDINEFEDALASGGVPILGGAASANEVAEEEEDDDDITNRDNIRQAHTVITTRDAALPDNTNIPRTRLTFSIEAPVARNALGLAEDPRHMPLDRYEQFFYRNYPTRRQLRAGERGWYSRCRFASRVARSNGGR